MQIQEACAVGIVAAMDPDDAVITSFRWFAIYDYLHLLLMTTFICSHGWTYLMGATPADVLSELTGRISGNVYGKGEFL